MEARESLDIAVVAPPWFEIPPEGYGGIEALCYSIVEGLIDRGHRVKLIAAGAGNTRAEFLPTLRQPPSDRLGEALPEVLHASLAAQALDALDPVDVIHDNSLAGPLLAHHTDTPTVVTAHGPVEGELGSFYSSLPENAHIVAISNAQRKLAPHLNWVGTVYNGLPVDDYPFQADKEDFALFLGRMSPEKAPHLAIDACRAVGIDLVLAAKCNEPSEREYFEQEVKPHLGNGIEFIGEATGEQKKDLLARARCLVFPIRWEEPFGMVMVEAMACGTPVVALDRGSVAEVVEDGVSGFTCTTPPQLVEAIRRAGSIDPRACRKRAESFDTSRMVAGYEDVFRRLVAGGRGARETSRAAFV